MPRPKGSKKDKTQSNKLLLTSSSSQSFIFLSNDFLNDDINWLKTSSIINKGGRPKKPEFINGNDDSINSPTSSSSEISGGRVVINPAVLRYLEQNRLTNKMNHETEEFFNENTPTKDENFLQNLPIQDERHILINEFIEIDKFIQDDLFWDFCRYSTDFLTSARLAEWILTHQQSSKFETITS
jgi:hypothetical protein